MRQRKEAHQLIWSYINSGAYTTDESNHTCVACISMEPIRTLIVSAKEATGIPRARCAFGKLLVQKDDDDDDTQQNHMISTGRAREYDPRGTVGGLKNGAKKRNV